MGVKGSKKTHQEAKLLTRRASVADADAMNVLCVFLPDVLASYANTLQGLSSRLQVIQID